MQPLLINLLWFCLELDSVEGILNELSSNSEPNMKSDAWLGLFAFGTSVAAHGQVIGVVAGGIR